jgi:hypothetical protein
LRETLKLILPDLLTRYIGASEILFEKAYILVV